MRKSYLLFGGIIIVVAVVAGMGALLLRHPSPAPMATSTPPVVTPPAPPATTTAVIGHSVEGRPIKAYTFGTGHEHLLFVGGMHGGYEWNAVVLAYDILDYFQKHPEAVPPNETISIIPDLNPDAVYKVTHKEGKITTADVLPIKDKVFARFNANGVDLNRNFDCHWQPKSSFLGKTTSAGTAPFSEPETAALRNYVAQFKPRSVAFWHSKSGVVYGAACTGSITAADRAVMDTYAKAAGYGTQAIFNAYTIHGDAESWLTSIGIPAITVELTTHNSIEYQKNLAGVLALMKHFTTTTLTGLGTNTKATTTN